MRLPLLAEAVAEGRAVWVLEMLEAPVEGFLVNQARALITTTDMIRIVLVAEGVPNRGAGLLQIIEKQVVAT
jgi:hypothetical protein